MQLEVGPLQEGPVPHPDDLEPLLEPVGDPFDHVGQESAGEAVQRAMKPLVARALHPQQPALCSGTDTNVCASLMVAPFTVRMYLAVAPLETRAMPKGRTPSLGSSI